MSWFAKWFWECWFEMDNVHLHGSRRGKPCFQAISLKSRRSKLIPDYLEYKMGCVKTYNARNNFLGTYLISIPYYVFLGCSRRRDASAAVKSFETQAGNRVGQGQGGLLTPLSPFTIVEGKEQPSPIPDFFSLGPSMMEKEGYVQSIHEAGAPLSPFHYQLRKVSLSS
jgi:betaine lipid synthase